MKECPNYFAIIPANVRYDKDLRPNEKLLYGEISALTGATGYCFARNKYFAELYGVSERVIRKWINDLAGKGYIKVVYTYKNNTMEIDKRMIKIGEGTPQGGNLTRQGGNKSSTPPGTFIPTPPEQKFHHNNTSINNTSINNVLDKSVCVNDREWSAQTAHTFFGEFWDAYPNRKYKQKCKELWIEDGCDRKIDLILANIAKLKRLHREFPNALTYLENREYENEVVERFTYF